MSKEEAKQRIEKLKKLINHQRYLYHVLDRQDISDAAHDSLKKELFDLEQKFPEFITSDSPTQRVGGKPLAKFEKVRHSSPMFSLEDIFNEEELKDWEEYLKRLEPSSEFEFFTELKIDGFAVTLIYENGFFVRGATRGNGKIGEDVTQNLKTIDSISLKLEIKGKLPLGLEENIKKEINKGKIEVRGEVYMEKGTFDNLNKELEKKGEKTYSNPRNLAAGSIRQLDSKLAASRPLKFLAYDLVTEFGQKKHSEKHQILSALGFKTDDGKVCKKLNEVVDFWKEVGEKREKLPFLIDGVVVNINNNNLFKKFGVIGKAPRAARAFKFSPEQTATIIEDIKFQVGRTGAITPVAVLKPVEVGGVIISRATLHNEDEIKRLGVKIGDTVIVGRAGDVIPDIIRTLSELRTGKEKKFKMPQVCPSCGTRLVKPDKEVLWRCPNPKCLAQLREYFYHFVSRGGFDIVGLGPKIIDKLIDEGVISDPADLFLLKEGDIISLERFAEKSAQNLISAIQAKKRITLPRFIYALGIRNVGEETAIDLAGYFGNIKNLKEASLEGLQRIVNVGPVVAESIYRWFQNKKNLDFLEKLEKSGIEIEIQKRAARSQKLNGLTFVITGSLKSMAREDIKTRIRELGGGVSESVSRETDFVVTGESPGSKLKKAKELGAKTLSEENFLKMIK